MDESYGPARALRAVHTIAPLVHIPDKEVLAADAFRVLKPGGWFVALDRLISHDGEPSPEIVGYIAREDIDFEIASPARYRRALEAAGFVDVSLINHNPWYQTVACGEPARLGRAGTPSSPSWTGRPWTSRSVSGARWSSCWTPASIARTNSGAGGLGPCFSRISTLSSLPAPPNYATSTATSLRSFGIAANSHREGVPRRVSGNC